MYISLNQILMQTQKPNLEQYISAQKAQHGMKEFNNGKHRRKWRDGMIIKGERRKRRMEVKRRERSDWREIDFNLNFVSLFYISISSYAIYILFKCMPHVIEIVMPTLLLLYCDMNCVALALHCEQNRYEWKGNEKERSRWRTCSLYIGCSRLFI